MESVKKIVELAKKAELGVTVLGAAGLLYFALSGKEDNNEQ